jgi:hypothetical protein
LKVKTKGTGGMKCIILYVAHMVKARNAHKFSVGKFAMTVLGEQHVAGD